MVAEAQAKVDSAQAAYDQNVAKLNSLVDAKNLITQKVVQDQGVLSQAQAALDAQIAVVADRKATLDAAQAAYDNSSIPIYTTINDTPGLKADIYNYNPNNLPLRTTDGYTYCKTITVDGINKDWGGGDIEGCGGDFVLIHYTGFITVPTTDTYQFLTNADDGWYMTIGDTVVNDNWVLKGCGGWWSDGIKLEAGKSYPLDAWFYEYGGGACNVMYYMTSTNWANVPGNWFSTGNTTTTTTFKKDESLLPAIDAAQKTYNTVLESQQTLQNNLDVINQTLTTDLAEQQQNSDTIVTAQQNVTTSEQELNVSKQELAAIPPFQEPAPAPEKTTKPTQEPTTPVIQPTPEPVPTTTPEPNKPELPVNIATVDPQSLTTAQVEEIKTVANEILNNSEQGSPEYTQALAALFVAAQADDIKLDPSLSAVPGLSAAVDAINYLGNVGSDMSPKVREKSKKVVVTAVVAVGAAVNAATGAALMAAPAGGTSIIRRKQ